MSWKVIIVATDAVNVSADEFLRACNDYPTHFGKPDAVRSRLEDTLRGAFWESDGTGHFGTDDFGFEISLYDINAAKCESPVEAHEEERTADVQFIFIDVRGKGDPVRLLAKLAKTHNWLLIDTAADDGYAWIDLNDPSITGWNAFREYRDHVIPDDEEHSQS
ncbi:MAG: hypothetical protein KDA65_03245 [Planctomycetaceae bacterium]|nr:hypothetical protein [Planctomycetaceae bacterium]